LVFPFATKEEEKWSRNPEGGLVGKQILSEEKKGESAGERETWGNMTSIPLQARGGRRKQEEKR